MQPMSLSVRAEQDVNAQVIAQIMGRLTVAPHMASLQLCWLLCDTSCCCWISNPRSGPLGGSYGCRSSRSGIARTPATLHGLSMSGVGNSDVKYHDRGLQGEPQSSGSFQR